MTDSQIINKLQNENRDVYIYGNANHAGLVYDYLCNNGIEVKAFIVDKRYYVEDNTLRGKRIYCIDELADDLEKFNIVLGFCNVEKTRFLLSNSSIVKGNYYCLWEPLTIYEWTKEYIEANSEEFNDIREWLSDSKSVHILNELISAKVSCGEANMLDFADDDQYFNELTYSYKEGAFCDCGAFNGDTIKKFNAVVDGRYKKIFAFEPNDENYYELKKNTNGMHDLVLVNKGTWSGNTTLFFNKDGSASQIDDEGTDSIEVTSIDSVVGDEKVTFIKMDVEGSELETLIGARNTILRDKPKLAICCYHRTDDIVNFYKFIKDIESEIGVTYRKYLRHHSNSVYETVLYAIPI